MNKKHGAKWYRYPRCVDTQNCELRENGQYGYCKYEGGVLSCVHPDIERILEEEEAHV